MGQKLIISDCHQFAKMQTQQSTQSQQQQLLFEVGFARFKPGSVKAIQHLLSHSFIKYMLSKHNWRIKEKPFTEKWHILFSLLEEALCERLFIQSLECSSILTSIQSCHFPNLTVLNLSHNPINNLESIMFLHAPNLQFIFLQTNHIASVKPLAKIYFQNLEQIDLSNNKIQELPAITRLKTMKHVKGFSIELFTFDHSHHHHHWHDDEHTNRIETVNIIAKLENQVDCHRHDAKKKYEMFKRQFQYVLTENNSNIKFMNTMTQKKPINALIKKFCW